MTAIAPLPERITCTRPGCTSSIDSALMAIAAVAVDWFMLEGHWFCSFCRTAAPFVIALDRAVNAHQVTLGQLEQARDEVARLESDRSQAVLERLGAVTDADRFRKRCEALTAMIGTDRDAAKLRARIQAMRGEIARLKERCHGS